MEPKTEKLGVKLDFNRFNKYLDFVQLSAVKDCKKDELAYVASV